MDVYLAEQGLSLQNKITASCPVMIARLSEFSPKVLKSLGTNLDQPDLHYLETILASTGWNLNDEVFAPEEIVKARATPEDKAFNFEHDCEDIIGHITSACLVDDECRPIDLSLFSSLPKFHILTGSVLYKFWDKEEAQARMDKLLEEIAKGEWFVSMECFFTKFDYCLKDNRTGEEKIIARNAETAFLSSKLRAYGGDGKWQNYQVGRLPRDLIFSGKGLVKRPANPDSIILSQKSVLLKSSGVAFLKAHSTQMTTEESTTVEPQEEKTLAKEMEARLKAEAELKLVKAEVDSLSTKSLQLEAANKVLLDRNKEFETALSQTKASLDESEKRLNEAQLVVAEFAKTKRMAERVSKAKELLGIDEAVAQELVSKVDNLSDDQFKGHLDSIVALVASVKQPPQATSLPAPMKGGHKDVKTVSEPKPALPPAAVVVTTQSASVQLPTISRDGVHIQPDNGPTLAIPSEEPTDEFKKMVAAVFGCDKE